MRCALYFTPPPESPFTQAGALWLGRDAFTGQDLQMVPSQGLSAEEIAAATAEPRRYGFHATLKAPFRLAETRTEADLIAALEAFCAARSPFTGPRLALTPIHGFIALTPAEPSAPLDRLAGDAVEAFEPFRAPLTESELHRRRPDRLSPPERANLERWGYPYVFEQFHFHMTLTDRLAPADHPRFAAALRPRFTPLLALPLPVEGIALFREPAPGAPFTVRAFARFAAPAGTAASPFPPGDAGGSEERQKA